MTRPLTLVIPVAAAAVLIAALTGCTPAHGPRPAPSGSASTPSALVTGIAADTSVPQPALDIDCARLFSAPTFAASFTAAVHPVDPLATQASGSPNIPDVDVLQAVGGISCEWSNGIPYIGFHGDGPYYVGAQLSILPNAATQWAEYDRTYGPAGEGVQCNSTPTGLNCVSDQLVGSTWVELYMFGVTAEAPSRALAASIATAVSAAGPGAAAWTPPRGTTTFGDCTQLLTPSQVATDLGVTGAGILFTQPAGGYSIQTATQQIAHAEGCLLQYTDEDNTAGQITWLRGGAWAYDAALAAADPGAGAITPAPIPGLAAGDRAQVRCLDPSLNEDGAGECTVDLELGGNWIQVIYSPNPGDLATADLRTGALAVAAHLVAGYNAHAH